ncbi:MAG: transposase [bacterium]|nr:transposase [bacterium]
MVKNGRRNGRQRYRCGSCNTQEQSAPRPERLREKIWFEHVDGKQTVTQLAKTYARSERTIRRSLEQHKISPTHHRPRSVVLAIDATFWGRKWGVLVARDPHAKENLHVHELMQETPEEYRHARTVLEQLGYTLMGIVLDGKRGVREVFCDIPVQYCQFHQMKTVTKYLTRKPKTNAGWELRAITLTLARTTEKEFTARLEEWRAHWADFLAERTPCFCCKEKRWPYTHRRLRAAYRSLKTNLPFLFTYQKYPELKIPNTTNTLDGSFSHLKNQVGNHRGKRPARRYKIIQELLRKKEGNT